ncbi:MAG: hypothetical protein HY868_24660 [Chloroflexi bacterium]|nr:hypothetical protein [Chloroflexota bacterium]
MNPIALGIIVLGVVLLLVGLFLTTKRGKRVGIAISIAGIGAIILPFATSFFLGANP